MITNIGDFFSLGCGRCARFATAECSVRPWTVGLAELRRLCLGAGLTETVKWGHPCYMHAGRNIVMIGAFREDFRLTFFNAALMTDPDRMLTPQGPNTRHPDMIRFSENADVGDRQATITAYLREAMGYAERGETVAKTVEAVILPEELTDALDHDPALAEAFHALTPGRQKSYVIALSSAKTAATRTARVAKFAVKIFAGKGANDY